MYKFNTLPVDARDSLFTYFRNKKNGHKLKHDQLLPFTETTHSDSSTPPRQLPPPYRLIHSVIKIDGKLYQMGRGQGSIIDRGSFGKVKFVQNLSTGKLCVLKIAPICARIYTKEDSKEEDKKLADVNIGIGKAMRTNKKEEQKNYSLMHYMGVPLNKILAQPKKYPLSDPERFSIAVNLCMEVHKLHNGILSNSGVAYSHHDIKPSNITLSGRTKPTLIDYGIAQTHPRRTNEQLKGAPIYMPMFSRYNGRAKKLTRQQVDMLALKRTLYMPNTLVCIQGAISDQKRKNNGMEFILPEEVILNTPLSTYVNTSGTIDDGADSSLKPLSLAAILVLAKHQVPHQFYRSVESNENLAKLIMACFYLEQESPQDNFRGSLIEILNAEGGISYYSNNRWVRETLSKRRDLATLIDCGLYSHLSQACEHPLLLSLLRSNHPAKFKRAAIILFKLDTLNEHAISYLSKTEELPEIIINNYYHHDTNAISQIFSTQLGLTALQKLKNIASAKTIFEVSHNIPLLNAFAQSTSIELSQALLALFEKNPNIRESKINALFFRDELEAPLEENKERIKAINLLKRHRLETLYETALRDDNALIINRTLTFLQHSIKDSLKDYCLSNLARLLNSTNYCRFLRAFDDSQSLYIIHTLFQNNLEQFELTNQVLSTPKLKNKFHQVLRDKTYPLSVVKNITENDKALAVFTFLTSTSFTQAMQVKILKSRTLIDQIHHKLSDHLSPDNVMELVRAEEANQRDENRLQHLKRAPNYQADQQRLKRLRQTKWPTHVKRENIKVTEPRQACPLPQLNRHGMSIGQRRNYSQFHGGVNPITNLPTGYQLLPPEPLMPVPLARACPLR